MKPKSSEDLPGPEPRKDKERETREAIVKDADKTDGSDRDLVHGEGGTLDLPTKPGDLIAVAIDDAIAPTRPKAVSKIRCDKTDQVRSAIVK